MICQQSVRIVVDNAEAAHYVLIMMHGEPDKSIKDRARDLMLRHLYHHEDASGMWVKARFPELEFEIIEAITSAVEQERSRCCQLVFGHASSDNVAQRTVDAIRGKKPRR